MAVDPTTRARISALTPQQQELLAKRLAERQQPAGDRTIRRRPPGRLPLSFAQQRLWFLDQLDPGSPHYNIPIASRLDGPIDADVLERSLNALVDRHESLRTTFALDEQGPVQVVHDRMHVPLVRHDVSDTPPEERQKAVDDLIVAISREPFHLQEGPLFRAGLIRVGPEEHVLMSSIHHIIADTWSIWVILRELAAAYDALMHGQELPLPPLPLQYGDYAHWQRGWLQGAVLDEHVSYWREQMSGDMPLLDLPFDRPRPAEQSFRGGQYVHRLPAELGQRIDALGQSERTGSFTVFLAGLAALLKRYSGQDRIGVGTPVTNRARRELEDMVGYLSNTLLLRVDLTGEPTFRTAVRRAHEVNVGAQAHQDLPFDKIVEIAQPERDLSWMPLIQVMFIFRPMATQTGGSGALNLNSSLTIDNGTSKFDLTFALEQVASGAYRLAIEYSSDLFDEETVVRIAGHWESLLAAAVADPDAELATLPLLTADERRRIVVDWNATDTAFPDTSCLHELIEVQTDRTPDAVAVTGRDGELTYRELNLRANRLANRLRASGAGPDVPVAISMDKGLDLVVGLLAVLKAGSAYVPLDPAYPADRLAFMLADAGAPILLTQAHLAERFRADEAVTRVLVDAERDEIAAHPDTRPAVDVRPENLAYLIYTSGSTGRPKSVRLDHRGRVNNFHDFNTRFGIGAGDCVLGLASSSFDMSAYDTFGTLMCGARLALPDPGIERDPAHWLEVCRRERVTVWHSVPALLEMFVEQCEATGEEEVLPLRLVLLGGDWIPVTLPERIRALTPGAQVISLGGATEVSMDSTIYPIGEVDPAWRSIPYGRPMANQRCFVLDGRRQPVPVGVPGDLYLGGVGVGRGYQNDPELTADRFLPSPLPEWPDQLIYRTGDRARYRVDGNLELLGRSDFQVKLRGWRIEPGEIEAALRRREGVREALVVLSPDDGSPRRLIGYLIGEPGHDVDVEAVRETLREELPAQLVPGVLMVLEAFPLSANGKIDRKALPVPEAGGDAPTYVAPRTRVERALADICQELLRVERIGVHDNFFALGGDSIMTIQVIARAKRIGIVLTPKQMFQHQTIAGLAEVAEDAEIEAAAPETAGTAPGLAEAGLAVVRAAHPDLVDVYPLLPMQRHMLERQLSRPRPGQYIIQADYLFKPGALDPAVLEEAWRYVVRRHPILRSSFAWEGLSEPVQIVHPEAVLRVEHHELAGLDVEEQVRRQAEIVRADREEGFDLAAVPLLRLHLLHIGDGAYKYVCTNHHIVLDGWSRAIVQQEAFAVYEAMLAGREPDLPEQRSFRDYVTWQRGLDPAAKVWHDYLEGFTEPTPLVRAKGRENPHQDGPFGKQRIRMSAEASQAVRDFSRRHQVTQNSVIQGAWLLLLSRYTGERDIVLGVTSSGRSTEFVGVDTVTGLCMNTLPFRTRIDPEQPLLSWLSAIQAQHVDLRQYEHTPVEAVLGRELTSLFECFMVFENYPWDGSLKNLADRVDLAHPMAQPDFQVAQFEFPLRVEVVPTQQTLLIAHYYPGTFAPETIAEMLDDWRDTIARMVADPDQPLSALLGAVADPAEGVGG